MRKDSQSRGYTIVVVGFYGGGGVFTVVVGFLRWWWGYTVVVETKKRKVYGVKKEKTTTTARRETTHDVLFRFSSNCRRPVPVAFFGSVLGRNAPLDKNGWGEVFFILVFLRVCFVIFVFDIIVS